MSLEDRKICNICNTEKHIDGFQVNKRRCKACQYEINKAYSKLYYQQNKERLIKMNIINYKIKNTTRGPSGRPRKYDKEINLNI